MIVNIYWYNLEQAEPEAFGSPDAFLEAFDKGLPVNDLELADKCGRIVCSGRAVFVVGQHAGMVDLKAFRKNAEAEPGRFFGKPFHQVFPAAHGHDFARFRVPPCWIQDHLKPVIIKFEK